MPTNLETFEAQELDLMIANIHEDIEGRYTLDGYDLHQIHGMLCELQSIKINQTKNSNSMMNLSFESNVDHRASRDYYAEMVENLQKATAVSKKYFGETVADQDDDQTEKIGG